MAGHTLDTSGELLLKPYVDGFVLVKPNVNNTASSRLHSIHELFQLSLNLYFLDKQSVIQNINETTAKTCNYPSVRNSIGKTRELVANTELARKIMKEDAQVIMSKKMLIFEEHFTRLDNISFPAIAFKFPWYNAVGEIIGIFGCSIALNTENTSMASALMLMINADLLKTPGSVSAISVLPGMNIDNIYLSKREADCLNLMVKGQTCKMIAKVLSLSPRTVEHYIDNIKAKFGVQTKAELIEKIMT